MLKTKTTTVNGLIVAFSLLMVLTPGCKTSSETSGDKAEKGAPKTVLELGATPDNPRNSEGDFITLKNGGILFIYTHFTDEGTGNTDFGNAYLASRY